jgi:hypothetical protein
MTAILPPCFSHRSACNFIAMGDYSLVHVPSKAQELDVLCMALRKQGLQFFLTTRGARNKGAPDLIVGASVPVAIWVRRSEFAASLSDSQHAEISRTEALGWVTLIAFGAREALRELQRRGVSAARMGDVYAITSARKCG